MTTTEESIRVDKRTPIERVACRAFLNADQADLVDSTWTKINLNATTYDLGKNFATDTYKFTVPVSGLYHIVGQIYYTNSVVLDKTYAVAIYKNNAAINTAITHASVAGYLSVSVNDEVYLEKDDYIELFGWENSGGNTVDVDGDASGLYTFLIVRLVSKEGIRQ